MKNLTFYKLKYLFLASVTLLLFWGCSRSVDNLEEATASKNPDIFIDTFSAGLEYAAFEGSVLDAFEVVSDVTYDNSEQSMRFEVPDFGDERGSYAGGTFYTNSPRDLSEFNAITFYARGSQSTTIDVLGFGIDLDQNRFQTAVNDIPVNSSWQKRIIPIPDPIKLTSERGLFFYSSGPQDGSGYTFWLDEVKFESLGTIVFESARIMDGEDAVVSANTGQTIELSGLQSIHNMPDGTNQTVNASPHFFTFSSSNQAVATVSEAGVVTVESEGTAQITATLRGNDAEGSLTVNSEGSLNQPTTLPDEPTQDPADVISLLTGVYDNVPVDTWNTGWEFSTAQSASIQIQGQEVIQYQDLNFVGIEFASQTIDASGMTHFRLDIWTPDPTDMNEEFKVLLVDFGANDEFGGGDDSEHELTFTSPTLQTESWVTLNIPLSEFTGLQNRSNLAQLVLSGDLPNVYVTNVYFYSGEDDGNGGGGSQGVTLPVTFEDDNVNYALTDFGGNASEIVTDPTDGSNTVAQSTKTAGSETWAGTTIGGNVGFENPIPFTSTETTMSVRVWSPTAGTPIRLKVEDAGNNEISVETEANTTVAQDWETLVFDFSNEATGTASLNLSNTYDKASIFFNFGTSGSDEVYYWDDVEFGGDAGNNGGGGEPGTEPATAAPTPTQDSADVISVFSDSYTDIAGTNLNPGWGQQTAVSFVDIQGNETMKYTGLNYQGIELGSNQDVTGMNYLHIDFWSANSTNLSVFLISPGPVEEPYALSVPTSGWASVDIPLSEFSPVDLADIFQLKFEGNGDIYLDNIYFWSDGSGGGGNGGGGDATWSFDTIDFENDGYGADWDWTVFENGDNPPLEFINNPDPSAPNTSSTVAKFTATAGSVPGTEIAEGQLGDFRLSENNCVVSVDVWKEKISDVGVKFDAGAGNWGGARLEVANTQTNQWETITFNFCVLEQQEQMNPPEGTFLKRIAIWPDLDQDSQERVLYFDNITFSAQ